MSLPVAVHSGDATIDLVLKASGGLTGTVTGATKNVLLVIVQSMPNPQSALTASLDANGGFRLDHVPEGDYSVWLMLNGHGGVAQPVTVIAGDNTTIALVAPP